MSNPEFDTQFDILYDNISSNSAPGLNKFEKSVFLTRAQEEIVKQYYTGVNLQKTGFDGNEDVRRALEELVKTHKATIYTEGDGLSKFSRFYQIPENVFFIVFEKVAISNGNDIMVKPITHDEYHISSKNPFRKPSNCRAWRLDVAKLNDAKVVEIITEATITEYFCRYVEKPSPIVLTNFEDDSELSGLGLTIEGVNTNTECKLSAHVHSEILNRAVELAIRAYRENTLQANVELNKNNV